MLGGEGGGGCTLSPHTESMTLPPPPIISKCISSKCSLLPWDASLVPAHGRSVTPAVPLRAIVGAKEGQVHLLYVIAISSFI